MSTIYSFKDVERKEKAKRVRTIVLQVVSAVIAMLVILSLLFSMGCASTAKAAPDSRAPHGERSYYESNIKDFSEAKLKNGIPVHFKQQQGKTAWVGLVIDGGSVLVPAEKSGLEDLTLSLMLHGSQNYPYSEIQRLEYERSFALTASAGREYAVVSARFIQRDVDDVLSLLGDSVLHPLLSEEDFATLMTDERANLQQTLSDPSGVLGDELRKAAFAAHPYASASHITPESVGNLALEDVRAHHAELLNAARLSIVAVGAFDDKAQKSLVTTLNGIFGSLPAASFERLSVPPLSVPPETATVYASCETAADTGYIAGFFACPERTSDEYVAFAIALMYIDDLLFAQVREQHGAVYSAGTGVLGASRLLGAISLYKATEKQDLQRYVYEAIDSFPDEAEIAETLDRYKNKYITTLFSSSQTVAGVAGNVVSSLSYYGSPTQYLQRSEQVQAVTASDVAAAYRTYLARSAARAEGGTVNPMRWVVVSGADAVHDFAFE